MHNYGETVTRHHWAQGEPDGYGGYESTWSDTDVENVGVAMTTVQEPAGDGTYRLVRQCTLYFRPALAVDSEDEFTVRGDRYKVESGEALSVWRSPLTGTVAGSEVTLRRVTG